MGLFKTNQIKRSGEEIPMLPELPRFPELPKLEDRGQIHKLPSYPQSSFGEKFSQNAIKEAVSGKEEGDEEVWDADEFAREQEMQMMQQPLKKPMTRQFDYKEEEEPLQEFKHVARQMKKTEPLFIRIDKFEESLNTFETIKKRVSEIDNCLKEIKSVREEEEKELGAWEDKIQAIKKQIEKIDKDLFSKIE